MLLFDSYAPIFDVLTSLNLNILEEENAAVLNQHSEARYLPVRGSPERLEKLRELLKELLENEIDKEDMTDQGPRWHPESKLFYKREIPKVPERDVSGRRLHRRRTCTIKVERSGAQINREHTTHDRRKSVVEEEESPSKKNMTSKFAIHFTPGYWHSCNVKCIHYFTCILACINQFLTSVRAFNGVQLRK
ncbi:hypothetical protein QE152_g3655 [Popillia japonica]|uniref:Uncharacterized protein n=1 Tax=Popillia japonica TaxID=7064 RepID=A0AAW1N5B8_POPJA